MSRSPEKNQPPATKSNTVSKSVVKQLQKTIKQLKDENSQLKLELKPSDFNDKSAIGYLEDIVAKASSDIFDGYSEDASNALMTYSINIDTYFQPTEIKSWNRFSISILHEMWEKIITACQRGPLIRSTEVLYDSSKTDNLKPPKTKRELSDILHETIEKPAARLVNAVEQKLGSHPNRTCVWYQDHVPEQIETEASKSFAESYPDNAKMLESTSHTQPDVCFFGYGKLLMAGVHVDPQSLNVDSYKRFERFYEQHKRDKKSFTDMLRKLEQKTESDASLNGVSTVFNIMLITYSLMAKYNLMYSYATTGRCWLVFYTYQNSHNTLYYAFFELNRSTEGLKKCQSTDYQYFKQTAFVKVVSLLLDIVDKYRQCHSDIELFQGNSQPYTPQESEVTSFNAKHLQLTDEIKGHGPNSHLSVKKQKTGHDQPSENDAAISNRHQPRPEYCTQKCLLGLKSNAPMHQECPNYAMHKKYSDSDLHPIKNTDLGLLFYRQLKNKIRSHIRIARYEGKFGIIFKTTIYPHGYTFIGKGVNYWTEEDLKGEIYVYKELEKIQGEWIPVYLDCIKLSDNVRIDRLYDGNETPKTSLLIFLSYVGESMLKSDVKVDDEEIKKMKGILYKLGILHEDMNLGNILWSKELNHGMLIDMGQVYLLNK